MLNPNDNAEDISCTEYLNILMDDRPISIDGELYDIADITKQIDEDSKDEFIEAVLFGDDVQVRELYIQTIKEIMGDD